MWLFVATGCTPLGDSSLRGDAGRDVERLGADALRLDADALRLDVPVDEPRDGAGDVPSDRDGAMDATSDGDVGSPDVWGVPEGGGLDALDGDVGVPRDVGDARTLATIDLGCAPPPDVTETGDVGRLDGGCPQPGYTNCGGFDPFCVDLTSYRGHCGACFRSCPDDNECFQSRCRPRMQTPRPSTPQSDARTTSRRPRLRWEWLREGPGGSTPGPVHVQVCMDSRCANVEREFVALGTEWDVPVALEPGRHHWRIRGFLDCEGRPWSEPRPMRVGRRSALVNTSWGLSNDFNRDGRIDLTVTGPGAASGDGRVYLFQNTVGAQLMRAAQLEAPERAQGFGAAITVIPYGVTSDLRPGLAVGAPDADSGGGRVYLYRHRTETSGDPVLTTLEAPRGELMRMGTAVQSIEGEILAVGAPEARSGAGEVFLYRAAQVTGLSAPDHVLSSPTSAAGGFGTVLARGGDLNGDGREDLIVGAPRTTGTTSRLYARLTAPMEEWYPRTVALDVADWGSTSPAALSVTGAVDLNGDGYADVVVGLPNLSGGGGRVYGFFGSETGPSRTPSWTVTRSELGFGRSVAAAGDVNGDGYDDILVGATSASATMPSGGAVAIFLGGSAGPSSTPATTLGSHATDDGFGSQVWGPGDLNDDGIDDIVVAAPFAGSSAGTFYVYFGRTSWPAAPPEPDRTIHGPDGPRVEFGRGLARASGARPTTGRAKP